MKPKKITDIEKHLEAEQEDKSFSIISLNTQYSGYVKVFWFFILLLSIYLLFIRTGLLDKFFVNSERSLHTLYLTHPYVVYLILVLILYFIIILALPSQMIICILAALIIKNVWISFWLMMLGCMLGSISIYFISNYTCSNFLYRSIAHNEYFQVILEENKKHPWLTAFFTRLIFISAGLKDYILAIILNPFPCFVISAFVLHAFYTAEAVLIASQFKELKSYLNDSKEWSQKSTLEKISFISMIIFIILTIAIISLIGFMIQKRMKKRKKRILPYKKLSSLPNLQKQFNLIFLYLQNVQFNGTPIFSS